MEDCHLPHPCRVGPAPPHALGGLALSHVPRTLDKLLDSGDTFSDLWMGNVVEPAVQQRRDAVPNPYTHGTAAQIVHGFASIIPEVVALGPVGAGVLEGVAETAGRIDEGKPLGTAAALGGIHGVSIGLGAALPAAAPVLESVPLASLTQRLLTGAGGNLALGAADRAARSAALESAGFHEEAAQWRAFDPTYATVDLIMGAGFGALAHLQAKPSDVDAALTLNAQRNLDDQAPGLPKDALAAQAHQNAMRSALNALDNGEEVTARVDGERFIPDPVREQQAADRLAIAGNRLTREDRRRLEYEQRDLQFKLDRFDEQAAESGYTKQDFIDQARAENPRAPARQVARIAEQMAADAKVNDRADLQGMLQRVNQQLGEDAVAREMFGELDRASVPPHDIGYQFARKTGRKYEPKSTYADGTAHLFTKVLDFYDRHVAHLPAKGNDLMPDALFRIGEVGDSVAAGLRGFLPGFRDDLREARVSAQAIKHIHDSRPGIARSVLQRLEQGVLQADEVLPNPKNPERALLVLHNVESGSKKTKHGVTVLEVSANGKGIDIVSSMTSPDKYLSEARALRDARSVQDLAGGAAVPSSSLSADSRPQHHPAADFPKLSQDLDSNITQGGKKTTDIPELAAARQLLDTRGDETFSFYDDDGNEVSGTLRQLLDEIDQDAADLKNIDAATQAAITCFLRFEDNP